MLILLKDSRGRKARTAPLGERYGRLLVLDDTPYRTRDGKRVWSFLCDCGMVVALNAAAVSLGRIKSCGCLKNQRTAVGRLRRKYPDKNLTLLLMDWTVMRSRCYNQKDRYYDRFGGAGARMCSEWLRDPVEFVEWALKAGWVPGKSIKRVKDSGIYSPENCRIV